MRNAARGGLKTETAQRQARKTARKTAYAEARRQTRELERLKRRSGRLQEEIAELEEKARDLQGELEREDLMTDWEKLEEIDRSRSDVQEAIDTRLSEWESVEADLDRMRTHAEDPRCR